MAAMVRGEAVCMYQGRGVYLARLCAPLLAEGTLVWMRQATLMGHATRTQSTAAPASAAHTTASRSSRRPPVHMRLRCCRRSSRTFRQASGGLQSEFRCLGQHTCLHQGRILPRAGRTEYPRRSNLVLHWPTGNLFAQPYGVGCWSLPRRDPECCSCGVLVHCGQLATAAHSCKQHKVYQHKTFAPSILVQVLLEVIVRALPGRGVVSAASAQDLSARKARALLPCELAISRNA